MKEAAMQWYYSKNGTQLGPVPLDELRAKIASGEVAVTEMAWREGFADWRRISTIEELSAIHWAGVSNSPSDSPYAPPMVGGGTEVPVQTCGLAVASLVLGIVGIFCTFLPGIGAVICGHLALKQIANPSFRYSGRGLAISGLVLGYISIAIFALTMGLMVLGFLSESNR